MYDISVRIRYSEADSDGKLSMRGLLRLFQDCGYFHAADRGLGEEYTKKTGCTWYLLSWYIHAEKMPRICDRVTLSTGIYYTAGSISKKSLFMYSESGELLAAGDTLWVYMDVAKQQPAETPPGLWNKCDAAERAPLPAVSRRISIPAYTESLSPRTVDKELTDTNGHANNVKLTELAMSYAKNSGECRTLRAEFRSQAPADSDLYPKVCFEDGKSTVVFANGGGNILSVYEFE